MTSHVTVGRGNRIWIGVTVLMLTGSLGPTAIRAGCDHAGLVPSGAAIPDGALARVRLPFVGNEGQFAAHVRFSASTFAGAVSVTDRGLTYAFSHHEDGKPSRSIAIEEQFLGAGHLHARGADRSVTNTSYFIGDQSRWRSNVATYNAVTLGEVWPGVDVELRAYGKNVEKLFTVRPGASPAQIQMTVEGVESLTVDHAGQLLLNTAIGAVRMTAPVAFQEVDGTRTPVEVSYAISGRSYGFTIGAYDPRYSLVIDPLLASTFMGGGANDSLFDVATDSAGNVYITGNTRSLNYPTTTGAYDVLHEFSPGSCCFVSGEVFVSKLNSDLSQLLASTFIGGQGGEVAFALAIDGAGNVVVAGNTNGAGFPITTGPPTTAGNNDAFVTKLSADLQTLIASRFLGGGVNEVARGIAFDSFGNIFLAGSTNSTNFPTTVGAFSRTLNTNGFGGADDIFVTKLTSNLTTVLASTFIGGSGTDRQDQVQAHPIAIDSADNVFVVGGSASSNYPTTPGAYDPSFNGSGTGILDVVVSKLSNDLSSLQASTFLGGTGDDHGTAVAVDSDGNVYLTGYSTSAAYPTTAGAYDTLHGSSEDAFVSKLDNTLSSLLASTFLGADAVDFGWDIALNGAGRVFITGRTNGPFPTTPGAFDRSPNGISDVFVSRLNANLTSLEASTLIGGWSVEEGIALALDQTGNVVVAGTTQSVESSPTKIPYPTTSGAFKTAPYETTFNDNIELFITKLTPDLLLVDAAPPDTTITSSVNGNGATVAGGGLTASTSMTFQFTGTDDAAVARFECSLDGAAYTTCTSPATFAGLTSGPHTFSVRAVDTSNNVDPTPATFTWTVDAIPPDTTITSSVDGNGAAVTSGGVTRSTSMTLAFTGTDNLAVARLECSLDGAAFSTCTSALTVGGLTGGPHTFAVSAVDTAGNVDATPATFSWIVDLTPPVVTVPPNMTVEATSASGATVIYAASATDNIDGTVPVTCSRASGSTFSLGTTTVTCTAKDRAGNTGTASFTVTVRDTTPPDTTITSSVDGGGAAVVSGGTTSSSTMTLQFTGTDAVGVTSFQCSLDDGAYTPCTSGASYTGLATGNHTFSVRAVDAAGNIDATPAAFTWTVAATGKATRTQGFWSSHFDFAQATWLALSPAQRAIGSKPLGDGLNDVAEMMGGFWSDIPKTSNNRKRSDLDQARMQLVQQLLAAMLNRQAFSSNDGGLIAAGKAAFGGTDRTMILNVAGALGAFNQSGDSQPIPAGVSPGSANPKAGQNAANKAFWDVLP